MLNCIQQYPYRLKIKLKLAPLPKNISLPVVTLDANVAAVPFNVPFSTTHLKVDSAKIALAMNQKSWRSYYPLLFVVE
jgi:hypothetical protein